MPGQADLDPVRAAVSIAEEGDGAADIAAGALAENNRFGAVFLSDFLKTFFADIEGLIPGYLLPFAFAPGAYPFEGMADPVGMMNVLGQGQALGADPALVPGMVFIALHPDELTVLDDESEAASTM